MSSPSTVITLGYGSFGSVNLVPTLGYSVSQLVYGPIRISACEVYYPGAAAYEASLWGPSAVEVMNTPSAAAVEAHPE